MKEYKGEIKDFPKEVVKKMLKRQKQQTGKKDIAVFESDKMATCHEDGFAWLKTKEGYSFWNTIIFHENFDVFFKKYPKKTKKTNNIELKQAVKILKKHNAWRRGKIEVSPNTPTEIGIAIDCIVNFLK